MQPCCPRRAFAIASQQMPPTSGSYKKPPTGNVIAGRTTLQLKVTTMTSKTLLAVTAALAILGATSASSFAATRNAVRVSPDRPYPYSAPVNPTVRGPVEYQYAPSTTTHPTFPDQPDATTGGW